MSLYEMLRTDILAGIFEPGSMVQSTRSLKVVLIGKPIWSLPTISWSISSRKCVRMKPLTLVHGINMTGSFMPLWCRRVARSYTGITTPLDQAAFRTTDSPLEQIS